MEPKLTPGRLLRLALWLVRGISSRSIEGLLASHPSYDAAAEADRADLACAMGLRPSAARRLLDAPDDLLGWARGVAEDLRARGGRLSMRGDPDAPDFGPLRDPPEVLFLRGSRGEAGGAPDGGRAVAVVGSRKAHPAALRLARRIGFSVAREGLTVVSGGAFGVDAEAHRGALDAGGHTLAVLGSGVLLPLPRQNRRLFGEILEAGGGLASELPPRESARPEFFPRRNRLVAALSRAVVVVRASETSGSLHTARAALELGRPVYVFPSWDESNAGARILLSEGAIAVEDEADLLDRLRGGNGRRGGAEGEVDRVLEALDGPPVTVAELSFRLGMEQGRVAAIVARLCRQGRAGFSGPGRFAARGPGRADHGLRRFSGGAAPAEAPSAGEAR